ncbi:hypothetical protein KQI88_09865 [Alkaliphilus sp. MSJ-5]|uniref:Lipoprotein n=1 Tax=Alkaliphilus flagellatus TaxID=2841507 RepID=A0ABS6G5S7_9FIRM|nr:hypothetical protein [Alkaliphilus flagellatus]MBU5676726.1 hypothetical protein [Alkaliphilus flagellatus]
MTIFLKNKTLFMLITILSISSILVGCVEKNVKADELLPQSIEVMKTLDSYLSDVRVIFTSESNEGGEVNMNAIITYNKEPFAYSNVQEITSTNKSANNPLDKLILSLLAKDGVVYTNNSITGLWIDETDPKLVKEVEDNADLFQNFNIDQFTDLEVISINKNKVTIKATANNSAFLKSLLASFNTETSGYVEMVIDIETKYMESFTYYPEIDDKSGEQNKITIKTKDFNNADEVVIPKEALYEK